jgi:sugar lactone lactonase YvrE
VKLKTLTGVVLALGLAAALSAHAQQSTQTVGMHAPPAPHSAGSGQAGKVVIDGKLDDWDLSGTRLMCYDVAALRDRYSAQAAFMYDAENVYVSLRWKDPTPMVNHYQPVVERGQAWKADCVQLRFKTDRIAHVDLWYYTDGQEPGASIHYGMFHKDGPDYEGVGIDDAMAAGIRQAFLKDADGKGYTQEIAIPWKLLTRDGRALKAGDPMICGFELLWGKDSGRDFPVHRFADNVSPKARSGAIFFWQGKDAWGQVTLEPHGNLQLPPQTFKETPAAELTGPVEIGFELPRAGYVTIAIDDAEGRRARNLVSERWYEAGKHTSRWDGADDNGTLLPAGDYRWKGLFRDALHIEYALSFNDPGTPPWETVDRTGDWISDHNNPTAVVADGERVYVNCPGVEAGWAPVALTPGGRKLWGSKEAGIAMAVDNGIVYSVLDLGGYMHLNDPAKFAPVTVTVTRLDARTGRYAPFDNPELPSGGIKANIATYLAPANNVYALNTDILNVQGAAAQAGRLCVSLRRDNLVRVIDGRTSRRIKDIPLEAPAGLAFRADGALLAVSGGQVVQVDVESGKATPLIAASLGKPHQVCVAPDGTLLVSDWGSMNVKRFSADGKKLLNTIGRDGGRTLMGAWGELRGGLHRPWGVAVDSRNQVWVAEDFDSPRRLSVWTLNGRFERETIGPGYYSGGGLLDPADRTRAYYHNMEFRLDYERTAWELVRVVSGQFGPEALSMPVGTGHPNRILHRDGNTHLVGGGRPRWNIAIRRPDGIFQPLAAVGLVGRLAVEGPSAFRGKDATLRFAWSDINSDGLVQADEVKFAPSKPGRQPEHWGPYWGSAVNDDLSLVVPATTDPYSEWAIWRFPVTGWTPCGAPTYDVAAPEVQIPAVTAHRSGICSVTSMADGTVVINKQPVVAYDAQGRQLWTYPNPDLNPYDAGPLRPGKLIGPQAFLGRGNFGDGIGEVFMLNGYNGSRFLMTADGLWVGHVGNDTRNGPENMPAATPKPGYNMDNVSFGGESFSGMFTRTVDGHAYTTSGGTDARVVEVKGLESIRRLAGAVTLTPELHAQARKHLDAQAAAARKGSELTIARGEAPTIDGDLKEWDLAKGVSWETGTGCQATAALRQDGKKFYLAWKVDDTSPMANAGTDYTLLFKTGDCVDLWLGSDPKAAADRGAPVAGDLRLLFSVIDGKPVAVLYRAVVPGTKSPVEFRSPARVVKIDQVEKLADAEIKVARDVTGYTLEASVPLAALGLAPAAAELRGDIGVILSDAAGARANQRSYLYNKATNVVMDIPDEAMFNVGKWGKVVVE